MREFINFANRWVILICLLSAGLYCVLRINRIESHRFFGATLERDLTVTGANEPEVYERTGYLKPGERIVAIDGESVDDLDRFRDIMGREHSSLVRLRVVDVDGATRELLYWDAERIPDLRLEGNSIVSWDGETPDGLNEALRDAQVVSVAGRPAAAGLLQDAYESHPWWLEFSVKRSGELGTADVLLWRSDYRSPWTLLLIGFGFGCLGMTVYRMRANTRSSQAFLWFSFVGAIFFMLRSIPGHYRLEWERSAFIFTLCALFVASAHFFGTFTSLRSIYMRSATCFYGAIAVGVGLLLSRVTLDIDFFLLFWTLSMMALPVLVFLSPSLPGNLGGRISSSDHQRNRIAANALVLSLGPSLVYLFVEGASERGWITFISQAQMPSRFWFDLPAITFPLVIGYAVIRRNLLQVNELLLEGATYGVLALGMGGAFACFVGLAVPAVEKIRPGSSVLMTAAAAGLVAWLAYPVFNDSRRRLEEHFHQSLRGYDSLASRIANLGETSPDPIGFCENFVPSLRELTRAVSVTIMLPGQFAPVPISSGSLPETIDPENLNQYWDRILAAEVNKPREIQREELIDERTHEKARWELLDALDALRLLFVFPLLAEGVVCGLVGVSGKIDQRNYSRAEVRKLRLVARECALALYGFTIRENMKAKLEAEENLRRSEEKLRDSQKLEAVATLAGGIAHDFHNLITAIFAFTAVAKDTLPFDHPAASAIGNVEEAARQASGITKSLLVFTRKTKSERRPLDLGQFVPRAARFVSGVLPHNVELVCEIERGTSLWVEVDESQLHQVIMNLVVNAKDAMPGGGQIRVFVSRGGEEHPDASMGRPPVIIEVRDNGPGMTEEVRRRAFEPFFTTKHRDKGTGLGLSIVRGIVQDNGGAIDLDSFPGEGTRIQITFPPCEVEARGPVKAGDTLNRGAKGSRILVADDNNMIRVGLSTCLTREGYEVTQAQNGRAFCGIVREQRDCIDLAVLDLDMPEMDGIECLEFLKSAGIHIPVIVVTGESPDRLDRLDYPDLTLLRKPFGIPGFMSTVNEMLSARSPQEGDAQSLAV